LLENKLWLAPPTAGDKPTSRSNSAYASIGSKFYLYGGTGKGQVLDEFYMLDTCKSFHNGIMVNSLLATMIWEKLRCRGESPGLRTCSTFAAIGKKLYLYGGGLWSSEEQTWLTKFNDLLEFDTEKLEWKKIKTTGQPPVMSTSVAMFAIGRCLYIYGGKIFFLC
jgi:N-acetylneuraminic acid mutarotase